MFNQSMGCIINNEKRMLANTRTIDPLELNSIKEKLSIAYMHGLNAYMNYGLEVMGKDMDGFGLDFMLINKVVGPGRTVGSEGNTLFLQLKSVSLSSASMISETEKNIRYKMSKSLTPIGTHFLIVVVVNKEENLEEWLEVNPEELILRSRAYYLHIPETLKAGFVTIPKENILNFETFPKLFETASLEKMA
jgi:hypothetical protein